MLKVVQQGVLEEVESEGTLERVRHVQRKADRTCMNGRSDFWCDLNLGVKVLMGVQRMRMNMSPLFLC